MPCYGSTAAVKLLSPVAVLHEAGALPLFAWTAAAEADAEGAVDWVVLHTKEGVAELASVDAVVLRGGVGEEGFAPSPTYLARREVGAAARRALHLCWAQQIPILDLDIAAGRCLAKHVFGRVFEIVVLDAEGARGLGGWEEETRWERSCLIHLTREDARPCNKQQAACVFGGGQLWGGMRAFGGQIEFFLVWGTFWQGCHGNETLVVVKGESVFWMVGMVWEYVTDIFG